MFDFAVAPKHFSCCDEKHFSPLDCCDEKQLPAPGRILRSNTQRWLSPSPRPAGSCTIILNHYDDHHMIILICNAHHGSDVANKPEVESYTGSFGKTCRMFAVARKGS